MLKLSAELQTKLAAVDARDRQNAFELGWIKQASELGLSLEEAQEMREQLRKHLEASK